MKRAVDVKNGNLLLIDNEIYKVEVVETKGSAKAHKTFNLKLRSIPEKKYREMTLNPEDKVEEIELMHKKAAYSYRDKDYFYFLDSQTYESYPLRKEFLGEKECFLKENMEIDMTFYNNRPLEVIFPPRIKVKVVSVDKGVKGAQDSNISKKARLENGLEIDVPQFISENDIVEIDTETLKYLNRIQEK